MTTVLQTGSVSLVGEVVDHKSKKLGQFKVFSPRRSSAGNQTSYAQFSEAERVYKAEVGFQEGVQSTNLAVDNRGNLNQKRPHPNKNKPKVS